MRLTTELLQAAHSYLNPLNDRELDLRGALQPVQPLHFLWKKKEKKAPHKELND